MMQKKKSLSQLGNTISPSLQIICFPYGGGGASTYRRWAEIFGPDVRICSVHLPGRETRYGELPYVDAQRVTDELLPELIPLLNIPTIFFGYSLGAALAYKTITECLKVREFENILSLICCARTPPSKALNDDALAHLTHDEFMQYIFTLGGISPQALNDPELRSMAIKLLRNDFALSASIIEPEDRMLNIPVYALGGDSDPSVSPENLQGWERCTSGKFTSYILPGGHFFMNENSEDFYRLLRDIVLLEKMKLR